MDRKKGDVKYQTTQTGETGKAELFRIYLAECRGPFGLFLLFCCIFACVFYLYRLPAEAVLYSHGGLQKVQEKIQDSSKNQEGIFDGSGQLLSG